MINISNCPLQGLCLIVKNIDKNKVNNNITWVYDKYLFPNKNNKFTYSINNLFLFDIINKVFKKMIELRDTSNKTITEEKILKEYNKQINILKKFFENKTKENNLSNTIKNKEKKYKGESIQNKETFFKNIVIKNKLINEEYKNICQNKIDNIINRETFFIIRDKFIKNSKLSLKHSLNNIFEKSNDKKSLYNISRKLKKIHIIIFNQ